MRRDRSQYLKRWYALRKTQGICRHCNNQVRPGITNCEAHVAYRKAYHIRYMQKAENVDRTFRREKKKRESLREDMFTALGDTCGCCQEWRKPFLTLDHIIPVRELTEKRLYGYYALFQAKRAGWPKDRFRVLCMNCNWSQRRGDPCPHTTMPNKVTI